MRAEEAPNDWLMRRGFDVNFHTHLETTGEGKLVVMCFDEDYTIEQGEIRPCVMLQRRFLPDVFFPFDEDDLRFFSWKAPL